MDDQVFLREQIARIDRALAEAQRFRAGERKIVFGADRITWDGWLALTLALAAAIGGSLGAATFIATLIQLGCVRP